MIFYKDKYWTYVRLGRSIVSSINRSDRHEIRLGRVKFWKIDYFRLSLTSLTS